ncbi:unnamed protein product [Notodromas monacha]|uniref:Ion transport domain-containing protein n=1 Tax=Notodromas monacha TaxID=399045 RepID=A0A7R9BBJ8_9CRUS|nr:unnamed protein product [Notodromas monacha]CAG0912281.1 unnamed protein product [Notodromas monacha]
MNAEYGSTTLNAVSCEGDVEISEVNSARNEQSAEQPRITAAVDQDYILATVYIRDARDGHNLPFIPEQPFIRNLTYPNGDPYFQNYLDSFFDIYVLVTTANNPDVMMPAFEMNRWSVLVFGSCIVICLYIVMSIFLAVIFDNFKKHLKNEIKEAVYLKRKLVAKAFHLLKNSNINRLEIPSAGENEEKGEEISWSTFSTWMSVYVMPGRSKPFVKILWNVLDDDGSDGLTLRKFLGIADLLNVHVSEVTDRRKLFEIYLPSVYNAAPSRFLRKLVRMRIFRYSFDFLILVNAIFIGFDVEGDWIFLALFTIEILLKLYTFGGEEFFKRFWNVFDFIVIGSADVLLIVEAILHDVSDTRASLDALLVLRVLRVVKLIGSVKGFKIIIKTIMNLGPALVIYGAVLFVFYYVYAIIGMELFAGLIQSSNYLTGETSTYCENPLLENSTFAALKYCSNNFNDIASSFVILYELTVVNQWHVLAQGFSLVTSKWARIYFMSFHLICVVVILNIFMAFVIEGYLLESCFSKDAVESKLEAKINEMGLGLGSVPTWIAASDSKKPPDSLLQNMEGGEEDDETFDADHEPRQFESLVEANAPAGIDYEEWIRRAQDSLAVANESKIRFHLSGSKSVEAVLHRMFENEIGDDDLGEESSDVRCRPRRQTLDNVA